MVRIQQEENFGARQLRKYSELENTPPKKGDTSTAGLAAKPPGGHSTLTACAISMQSNKKFERGLRPATKTPTIEYVQQPNGAQVPATELKTDLAIQM